MCLYAYNKQTVLSITACVAAPRCEKRFSSIATVHCCPRTWLLPDGNIRKISHAQDLYTHHALTTPEVLASLIQISMSDFAKLLNSCSQEECYRSVFYKFNSYTSYSSLEVEPLTIAKALLHPNDLRTLSVT